uniref:Uncharacterized protein n=1 Tax=Trichogramma kaykai TaxID=54128 RepID=A0ABD2XIK5_9HYME
MIPTQSSLVQTLKSLRSIVVQSYITRYFISRGLITQSKPRVLFANAKIDCNCRRETYVYERRGGVRDAAIRNALHKRRVSFRA